MQPDCEVEASWEDVFCLALHNTRSSSNSVTNRLPSTPIDPETLEGLDRNGELVAARGPGGFTLGFDNNHGAAPLT